MRCMCKCGCVRWEERLLIVDMTEGPDKDLDLDLTCRFIRDDEEPGEVSWEERLARAYESKLFKEFALVS